jgi:hypothetical protein
MPSVLATPQCWDIISRKMSVSAKMRSAILCPPLILSFPLCEELLDEERVLHREGNLQRFFSQQREEKRCETIVLAMCYRYYNILLCILLEGTIQKGLCSCGKTDRSTRVAA